MKTHLHNSRYSDNEPLHNPIIKVDIQKLDLKMQVCYSLPTNHKSSVDPIFTFHFKEECFIGNERSSVIGSI